jgi:hypothetical protein
MPFGGWSCTCVAVVIHDPTHRGPAASQLDDGFRPRGPEDASHRQSGDAPRIDTRFLKGVTKALPISPAGARILPCALMGGCVDLAAQPLHIDPDPGRRQECIAASTSDAGNADRSCRCDGAHQYAGVRERDDAAWASPVDGVGRARGRHWTGRLLAAETFIDHCGSGPQPHFQPEGPRGRGAP